MKYLSLLLVFSWSAFASDLVYMAENGEGKHIYLKSLYKNEKITFGNDWHLYPDISTDASKVAYVKGKDQQSLSLYLYRVSDGIEQQLSKKEGLVLHPRFTGQDREIYFSAPDKLGINQIFRFILNSKVETQVTSGPTAFFPSPSSDGLLLAYQRNSADKKEIVLLDMAAKNEVVIDEGMAPSFSKDDKYIAYTKKVNDNWDIYIYNRHDKKIVRATRNSANDFAPSFDRLGNLIFASDRYKNGEFSILKKNIGYDLAVNSLSFSLISENKSSLYAAKSSGIKNIKIKQKDDIPGEARSSFGSVFHRGRIYVVGGHQGQEHTYPPESFTGRMSYYDVKNKTWHQVAPRPNPCHGFQIAAYRNYIYAFGGFAYEENNLPKWKSLDAVDRYDIKKNKWETVTHMPRARSSNIAVTVGDKVYLIGGWDSSPKFDNDLEGTFHDEIDVYDLKTGFFRTLKTKLPMKRRAFSAVVKDEKILLIGGISEGASHFSLIDKITEFDTQKESFSEVSTLPFATFAPAAGILNNKIYVFGGMYKTGEWSYEYVSHVYQMDLINNKWENTGRYLIESKGFSQVVQLNNKLAVLGGHSYQNSADAPVSTVEFFSLK